VQNVLARLTVAEAELVEVSRRLGAAGGELEVLRSQRERAERLAVEAATVLVFGRR
jgi:hypothetical protein